jgi:hypothetical protein
MRRTLILTTFALLITPFATHAQTTPQATPPAATEQAPRQTCGFEFGTACGAPKLGIVPNTTPVQMQAQFRPGLGNELSCPVGFNAQLSTGPGMVIVDSGTRSPVSQQMLLTFRNPAAHGITSMRVTVHGLTAKGQTLPVVTDSANAPGTIDTPATLHLSVAPNSGNSTQLRVRGITSVRSIDLDEVIYADGSSWHTTANRGCRIEPNRVMLIASH